MNGGKAEANWIWAQTIWRLRKFRRWSQDRLALELQSKNAITNYGLPERREHIVRVIQRWEAGATLPSDEYSVLLVVVFALPDELASGGLTPGSELDRLMAAYEGMGYDLDRRRFLLSAAALAVTARDVFATWNMPFDERLGYVLRHPRSVDASVVDHLRQALQDLDARYDRAPSTSVLPAAAQHLSQVAYLREHAPSGRLQGALCAVETDSATLMGQLVWDASGRRDHATANAYYDQAIAAAALTNDHAAQALPRLRKSFVALYGERNPMWGLSLAHHAATLTENGASPALAGLALLHVAEAFARHCCICDERAPSRQTASMSTRPPDPAPVHRSAFVGFCFPPEVIVLAVRWYLRFGLSYRDVEELLAERGVEVDHVTVYRWVLRFTPLLAEAARPCRHVVGGRWRVDETYVKVAGRWRYVYRAIDQFGQVIDVYVSPRRDVRAARRFFERAIDTTMVTPSEVVTDRASTYPVVLEELLPAAWHRTDRYANNAIETDHGRLKTRLRPMRGLKQDRSTRIVIAGHAFVQNVRRGHYELAVEAPANRRVAVAFDELALAI